MTYIVFLPVTKVCPMLIAYFKMLDNIYPLENDNKLNNRRKVVYFVKEWCDIAKDAFYEDPVIMKFLQVGELVAAKEGMTTNQHVSCSRICW